MADASPQTRRSVSPEGKKGLLKGPFRLGAIFDAAVVLVVVVVAAVVTFGFLEEARRAIKASLYFGWVPAGAWAASVLVTLRYRPKLVVSYWRWWACAAAVVAMAIGILSFAGLRGFTLQPVTWAMATPNWLYRK